jgi:hypothetical protein
MQFFLGAEITLTWMSRMRHWRGQGKKTMSQAAQLGGSAYLARLVVCVAYYLGTYLPTYRRTYQTDMLT